MTHNPSLESQAQFRSLVVHSSPQLAWFKSCLAASNLLVPQFTKPIFVLSAPRAGSTHFYQIVRRLHQVLSFAGENDPMWLRFFPYHRLDTPTDYVSAHECDPVTIAAIKAFIFWKTFNRYTYFEGNILSHHFLQRHPIIYMEKTIANCFHIDAIEKIFPDALYIYLVRDGRANVSSIMESWQQKVGCKPRGLINFPANASTSRWCTPVPLGWESVVDKSLEEICAWTWVEHNRYVIDKYQASPSFAQRCLRLSYEELVANPLEATEKVSAFTGLAISSSCRDYINRNSPSSTTVSAPKLDKWKEKNSEAIHKILPMITPMMKRLGYEVSASESLSKNANPTHI
jgi:hypothetical protein